ncbi:MAG: alanine glycine permease, partial [Catalinimonas sp.]
MKKLIWLVGCLLLLAPAARAQSEPTPTIDKRINDVMEPITAAVEAIVFFSIPLGGGLSIPFVLVWLIVGALIFTVYMGFINVTGFKHAIDVVRGKYDDPNEPGEVSHFQALTAALSGTVGIGNIGG